MIRWSQYSIEKYFQNNYCVGDATHVLEINPVSGLVRFVGPNLGPTLAKFVCACSSSLTGSVFAVPWRGRYTLEIVCGQSTNSMLKQSEPEVRYIGTEFDVVFDKSMVKGFILFQS